MGENCHALFGVCGKEKRVVTAASGFLAGNALFSWDGLKIYAAGN